MGFGTPAREIQQANAIKRRQTHNLHLFPPVGHDNLGAWL